MFLEFWKYAGNFAGLVRQKSGLFYQKFGAEFNEFSLNFLKQHDVVKKRLKLRNIGKTHICLFWRPRAKG